MNAFLAVDWFTVASFVAGTLLGLAVGWIVRGWRVLPPAPPAEAPQPSAKLGLIQEPSSTPAPSRIERRARVRPDAHPLELEEGEAGPMILLIDDRLEMLGVHAAYLRKHGYRTLMAENGTTGLQFARAYHPTLIVLDHSMPDRTGVEVTRELKADPATAGIPILLMTALSYGAIGTAALEAGCAAFLPKPIEPSRLLREIEAHTPRH